MRQSSPLIISLSFLRKHPSIHLCIWKEISLSYKPNCSGSTNLCISSIIYHHRNLMLTWWKHFKAHAEVLREHVLPLWNAFFYFEFLIFCQSFWLSSARQMDNRRQKVFKDLVRALLLWPLKKCQDYSHVESHLNKWEQKIYLPALKNGG